MRGNLVAVVMGRRETLAGVAMAATVVARAAVTEQSGWVTHSWNPADYSLGGGTHEHEYPAKWVPLSFLFLRGVAAMAAAAPLCPLLHSDRHWGQ